MRKLAIVYAAAAVFSQVQLLANQRALEFANVKVGDRVTFADTDADRGTSNWSSTMRMSS
jgi:hypothetical protein